MMGEGYLTARTLSSMDALPNTAYDLEGNRPRPDQTEVTHRAYLLRPDFDLFACTQLISGHLLLLVFVCDHSLLRWTRDTTTHRNHLFPYFFGGLLYIGLHYIHTTRNPGDTLQYSC